jgi:hypothetical protein
MLNIAAIMARLLRARCSVSASARSAELGFFSADLLLGR